MVRVWGAPGVALLPSLLRGAPSRSAAEDRDGGRKAGVRPVPPGFKRRYRPNTPVPDNALRPRPPPGSACARVRPPRWAAGAASQGEGDAPDRDAAMTRSPLPSRGSLFRKYFLVLFAAVVVPLLAAGASEAWFGYRDQRAHLNDLLGAEARLAAAKIQNFIEDIRDQLAWTVQLPWTEGLDERRRIDALRLLRQVPAVVSLTLVDGVGKERLYVSRVGLNRTEGGADRSGEPAVAGARSARVWYGPVTFHRNSE